MDKYGRTESAKADADVIYDVVLAFVEVTKLINDVANIEVK